MIATVPAANIPSLGSSLEIYAVFNKVDEGLLRSSPGYPNAIHKSETPAPPKLNGEN